MLRKLFVSMGDAINSFIKNPINVLVFGLVFVIGTMVFNGNLIRLCRLRADSQEIAARIELTKKQTLEMDQRILKAQDPQFIELQARERFDLANESDLIFVFSNED